MARAVMVRCQGCRNVYAVDAKEVGPDPRHPPLSRCCGARETELTYDEETECILGDGFAEERRKWLLCQEAGKREHARLLKEQERERTKNLVHRGPVPDAVMAEIAAAIAARNHLLAEQEEREQKRLRKQRKEEKARRRKDRQEQNARRRREREERDRKLHAIRQIQIPAAVMATMKEINSRWSTEDIRLLLEPWGNCYLFGYLGYDMAVDFDGTLRRLR